MQNLEGRHGLNRGVRPLAFAVAIVLGLGVSAVAQTTSPTPAAPSAVIPAPTGTATPKDAAPPTPATPPVTPAQATPAPSTPATSTPPSSTPPAPVPPEAAKPTPGGQSPQPNAAPTTPGATPEGTPLAPAGKPQHQEIERSGSPGIPDNATTENVEVPARPIIAVKGDSSYDDAFKSIKGALDKVKAAMDKAGLKPAGHMITIFSEPDDKGFKFQAGVPVAQTPTKTDLGDGVMAAMSPSGKAIKFQHRGAYDDIDSTYDVITAFLDAKGLQVDSPYIEEYLNDLTTADDPNLQVDIYVFVKANASRQP